MTFVLDINRELTSEQIRSINNQKPIKGFCVMVDMCHSTAMKQERSFPSWCINTFNTLFMLHQYAFNGSIPALKVIGDCIIYFLESEPDLSIAQELMCKIITGSENFQPEYRSDVKVAAAFVEDVYRVSFFPGQITDYYGTGIDLTARMLSMADIHKVVINDGFFKLLSKNEYASYWEQTVSELDYTKDQMKGIDSSTKIYQFNIVYS